MGARPGGLDIPDPPSRARLRPGEGGDAGGEVVGLGGQKQVLLAVHLADGGGSIPGTGGEATDIVPAGGREGGREGERERGREKGIFM